MPSCRIQNICLAANRFYCCLIIGCSLKILTLPILVWPKHSHIHHPSPLLDLKHFQEYVCLIHVCFRESLFFFRRSVYHLVWRVELEYDIFYKYKTHWRMYNGHTHGLYDNLRKREKGMRRVTAETGWLKPKHRQSSADCRGGHTSLQA